jgi:hypothetical protein
MERTWSEGVKNVCYCLFIRVQKRVRLGKTDFLSFFRSFLGFEEPTFDLCCFYHFLRNSSVALLEAL